MTGGDWIDSSGNRIVPTFTESTGTFTFRTSNGVNNDTLYVVDVTAPTGLNTDVDVAIGFTGE